MSIKIDVEELDNVIDKIDYLIENCSFIQTSILSQLDTFDSESLFGITSKVNEKFGELDNYNNNQLVIKFTEIRDELTELKNNFIEQDEENKKGINGGN